MDIDLTASMGHSGWSSLAVGIRSGPKQSPDRICASEPLLAWENSALKWSSERENFYGKRQKQKSIVICVSPTVSSNGVSPTQSLLVLFGLIPASLLFTEYLAGAITFEPSPAGVTLHSSLSCGRCICHPWLASFLEILCEYKWHCFFPRLFVLKLYSLEPSKAVVELKVISLPENFLLIVNHFWVLLESSVTIWKNTVQ